MEFEKYKKLVEKYYQNDCRELNFQNRVIIPFLESVSLEEYDIVDSSTLYQNWRKYKDNENGICREKFADNCTPDLLITKNWKLFDNDKKEPFAIIEVKRPTAKDRKHANEEISEYLRKARHVILTDSITWEFYESSNIKEIKEIISLDENNYSVCKRDLLTERKINWSKGEQEYNYLKEKIQNMLKTESLEL